MFLKPLSLLAILAIALTSCGKSSSDSLNRSGLPLGTSSETLPDCTGYKSEMIVPYGLNTTTGQAMAGKVFAKLVAVDQMDGTMKITILPPGSESNFSQQLLNEFSDYTIRLIACREVPSSVMSGFSTSGVCNKSAPISTVGAETVIGAQFTSDGFVVDGIKIHATVPMPTALKPNFIMLTAGLVNQNAVGDFMIAYGRSPYYTGCYNR